ncbi:hypothetical protein GTU71_13070 [Rathayibacter sp. VKM Ac-2762]|uniref:nuclear transport factor 2 family protein n=1 Tax=Rathayibacter sp. VKM Ac-2762 TaxID=2609254 RepID=UPI00132F3E7F|nr:nuclear transport factor 2 family protein [Rathayibacter sp. VKM Ac-2762]QHF21671.1 hypothetical protein GTU71_13070 [Rathayibacter sp. VKM Ac-2762]
MTTTGTTATTDTTTATAALPFAVEQELGRIPLLWARALDTADASVLEDLLTDDVVVDMTPATTRIGLEFPVLQGSGTVIPTMIGAVGPLDTMHAVSNVTASRRGDGYLVEAYALAQHFLPGEGPVATATRHALMGNTWTFHVRVTPEGHRVERFVMDCRWMEGDPLVLLAAIS